MKLTDIERELERELETRDRVYSRLMAEGRLDQLTANLRIQRMTAALDLVQKLIEHGIVDPAEIPLRMIPKAKARQNWGGL